MAKISTYPVDGLISTDDFIIGSDAENVNITKNFTVGGILSLSDLQMVLDNGNTATSNITLVGNVSATNVTASDSVNTVDIEVSGLFYDGSASEGVNGQFLKSTGTDTQWSNLPVDTLNAVLTAGNTTALNIVSTGDISANSVSVTDASVAGTLTLDGSVEADGSEGVVGQYLASAGIGNAVQWASLPIAGWNRFDDNQYAAGSPLNIASGDTVLLTNDGDKFSSLYGPNVFYDADSSTFLADNVNDTYMVTVTFIASASNAGNGHMDIIMTGPVGYNRVSETLKFAKGNNTPQNFHMVYQYYADADFVANGAQFELTAVDTDLAVYDIIYFIQRVQIA
jgi:hypothetical protein